MKHLRHTTAFSFLLVGMLLLPTQALVARQIKQKKQVYATNITTPKSTLAGSSMMIVDFSAGVDYLLNTTGLYGFDPQAVTEVYLNAPGFANPIVLCTDNNASAADDCTHDSEGNVYLDDSIVGSMLAAAGVGGGQFIRALRDGLMTVNLSDGNGILASGTYARII